MRKIVTLILGFVLLGVAAQAQMLKPVKWVFTSKKLKAGLYEIHLTATMDKGWTTYSQWTPAGGPEPTVISFEKNANVQLDGKVKELGEMKKKHEATFGVDVHYFADKVDFVQVVKVSPTGRNDKMAKGKVKFMVCDKEQCINEEVEFKIDLK